MIFLETTLVEIYLNFRVSLLVTGLDMCVVKKHNKSVAPKMV